MKQYRIKYERRRFYPQWKGWFFWHSFGTLYYGGRKSFKTLPEALDFIDQQADLDHPVEYIDVVFVPEQKQPATTPGLDAWGRAESLL